MIYLIYGKSNYLIKKEIDKIISSSNIDNIIYFDYDESDLFDVINEVNCIDLFNSKKLIVLSNFTFKSIKEKEENVFINYLYNKNENVIIIKCIDDKLDGRKKIVKKLLRDNNVIEILEPDKEKLAIEIKEQFNNDGFIVEDKLIKKIISYCNYQKDNSDYVFNEVNKLMMYKYNYKKINNEDIDNVVSKNTEKEIFALVNAVEDKNAALIFKEFKKIIELNVDPFDILVNLTIQFRQILQIKILSEQYDKQTIAYRLGIKLGAVEILTKYSYLYSLNELINIIDKIFDLDEKMKTETIDRYKLLEQFFLDL